MLAVFVTFEFGVAAAALFVLEWSLVRVILTGVVIHVLALFVVIVLAAARGHSRSRHQAERGRVAKTQAPGAWSPIPPRDV